MERSLVMAAIQKFEVRANLKVKKWSGLKF
jgi:hypothetical protein